MISITLSNDEVELEIFEKKDEKKVFEAMNDEHTQKYLLTIPIPYSMEDATNFVKKAIESHDNFENSKMIRFAIRSKTDKDFIGCIEVRKDNFADSIGVWTMPKRRGNGYIKKAVQLAVKWALDNRYCKNNEIYWGCQKSNNASKKIALSCGFKYCGTICSTDEKSKAKNEDGSPLLNRDGEPVIYDWYLIK